MSPRFTLLSTLACTLLACGCFSTSRDVDIEQAAEAPAPAAVARLAHESPTLPDYLWEPPGPRTFQQKDLTRKSAKARDYGRRIMQEGRTEGALVGRIALPLDQYLDRHSQGRPRPKVHWPGGRGAMAFFIEFDPPVMEWPSVAAENDTVVSTAAMTVFDGDGVPFVGGTARRTVRVAGYESVQVGDKEFADAARLEADTELSFGWMASIRVRETAWFARDAGLVRRDERFVGRAMWLFRFHSNTRYELAEPAEGFATPVADGPQDRPVRSVLTADPVSAAPTSDPQSQRLWSRLAICLERTGRHLQISGLAVEFE